MINGGRFLKEPQPYTVEVPTQSNPQTDSGGVAKLVTSAPVVPPSIVF